MLLQKLIVCCCTLNKTWYCDVFLFDKLAQHRLLSTAEILLHQVCTTEGSACLGLGAWYLVLSWAITCSQQYEDQQNKCEALICWLEYTTTILFVKVCLPNSWRHLDSWIFTNSTISPWQVSVWQPWFLGSYLQLKTGMVLA